MKTLEKYLAQLILAQLKQKPVPDVPEGITAEAIIEIATKQHLKYLLLGALIRTKNISAEEQEQIRELLMGSIIKTGVQVQEQKSLEQCFEERGIVNQPMKGAVLRFLYPSPEMREMSDLDILFAEQNMEEAEQILKDRGYTLYKAVKHHDIFRKPPFLVIEAHHAMYDKTVDRNQYGYFQNFSRTTVKEGCKYTQVFSGEDFYVYMMAHAAKHFYQTGCGIRHLVDIYVYLERFGQEMNREYIDSEMQKCGILTFAEHMEKLAYLWLEGGESEEFYDNLFAYMLDSGIYGKDENGIWNQFAKEKQKGKEAGRFRLKLWYAFPPAHYMAEYYPYLEEKPWLLPWAWLVRGVGGLFFHKGKYKRRMIQQIDAVQIRKLQNIYEKMDLHFKS